MYLLHTWQSLSFDGVKSKSSLSFHRDGDDRDRDDRDDEPTTHGGGGERGCRERDRGAEAEILCKSE